MKLPSKPSELIRTAISDLEKCEDLEYDIYMSDWYVEDVESGHCSVCLAGAVMSQREDKESLIGREGSDETIRYEPKIGSVNMKAYKALDELRQYNISAFNLHMDASSPGLIPKPWGVVQKVYEAIEDRHYTSYAHNPDKFKSNMLKIADVFEELKL